MVILYLNGYIIYIARYLTLHRCTDDRNLVLKGILSDSFYLELKMCHMHLRYKFVKHQSLISLLKINFFLRQYFSFNHLC